MDDQKQQQNEQISLYKKAIELFKKKEYQHASELFKEIKDKNILTQSFELQMNLLLCDFYQRNCSNHIKLLDDLNLILKSLDSSKINNQTDSPTLASQPLTATSSPTNNFDLNQTSSPQASPLLSVSSNTQSSSPNTPVSASITASASTSSTNLHSQQTCDIDNDQAIILYNQAVVYFHVKQYGSSYKILDNIYQNVLSLDDYLAIRVCLLLVNVSIEAQLYDKAGSVLSFLEKSFDHFFYISPKSTTTSENNNENHQNSTSSISNETTEDQDYQHTQMAPTEFKFLIHFYKSKIYLLSNSHYLAKNEIEESIKYSLKIDYIPLIGSCHLLSANYYSIELDTDNTIKNLLLSSSSSNNSTAAPSDTIKNKPISFGNDLVVEPITPRMFYNNIGSFHFNMDNKVLANYYFSRSLKEASFEMNGNSSFNRHLDKRTEVFFNTGIILMAMGKYELAFSCLQESCILLKCNPLVWLRLAECCIFAHISKLKDNRDQNNLDDDELIDEESANKENEINSDENKDKSSNNDDSNKPNSISSNSGGDSSRDLNNKNKNKNKSKSKNKDKDKDNITKDNGKDNSGKDKEKENGDTDNENENDSEGANSGTSGGPNSVNNVNENNNNNNVNFELVFGSIKILNNENILLPTVNGLHQGLQIEDSGVQSTLTNSGDELEESLSRLGTLSLDFASKCLRNAHYLERKILQSKKQRESQEQPTTDKQQEEPIEPNDLFKNYHIGMMLSILSSQAYVALCTYNPIVSLVACKQILSIFEENPNYSEIGFLYRFKYYAHIYAAEACINLNIPDQAVQFLSIDFIAQQLQIREVSKYDTTDFNNIFYYNLTIAYILQNDLNNAEKSIYQIQKNLEQQQFIILQQLNNNNNNQFIQQQIINLQQQQINDTFNKINLLKVYLELRKGNNDKALGLIKTERPIPQL
ncbi:hypothetical protein DICPUDRAFT_155443 [Dictyostelium purpureum]|uniref:CCR4-NOT transcription complex subunit 10 n=1 Tax=Dictyostelium purpureum TaxID=5786 RepID=F0ZU14_DICPU|nr:uncharacterized protein DICPUDRAFT_155443 [Dictyostelium purpureum]EGC32576.1 hypothetical protein DICPUDRAFT_155443 [Dictyostelium purpureum]|eukprot:XP_003290913.1 hypothetical protein DICPUDRAFT_155443 [Dictyostelium purpureum]